MSDQELFAKLKMPLRKIKNTAIGLLEEIQVIENCNAVERVQRCRNLHGRLFNKFSQYYGFADRASAFEFEIDDGVFWEIQEQAILECVDEGIIEADAFGLDSSSPDWPAVLDCLENLPLDSIPTEQS